MIDAARDVMAAALGKICEGFPHDGRTFTILKGFPEELCCVVVATASEREAPLRQIATDFGISEGVCISGSRPLTAKTASALEGGRPSPNSPLTMSPRTMSHIDVFGAVTAIESFSGCPRDLEEPLMPEAEWIDAGQAPGSGVTVL